MTLDQLDDDAIFCGVCRTLRKHKDIFDYLAAMQVLQRQEDAGVKTVTRRDLASRRIARGRIWSS